MLVVEGDTMNETKCFACGKKLKENLHVADTRDSQTIIVGPCCYRNIKKSGEHGYQPPRGGPKLWRVPKSFYKGYQNTS